jgi:hypothetical protein
VRCWPGPNRLENGVVFIIKVLALTTGGS